MVMSNKFIAYMFMLIASVGSVYSMETTQGFCPLGKMQYCGFIKPPARETSSLDQLRIRYDFLCQELSEKAVNLASRKVGLTLLTENEALFYERVCNLLEAEKERLALENAKLLLQEPMLPNKEARNFLVEDVTTFYDAVALVAKSIAGSAPVRGVVHVGNFLFNPYVATAEGMLGGALLTGELLSGEHDELTHACAVYLVGQFVVVAACNWLLNCKSASLLGSAAVLMYVCDSKSLNVARQFVITGLLGAALFNKLLNYVAPGNGNAKKIAPIAPKKNTLVEQKTTSFRGVTPVGCQNPVCGKC